MSIHETVIPLFDDVDPETLPDEYRATLDCARASIAPACLTAVAA